MSFSDPKDMDFIQNGVAGGITGGTSGIKLYADGTLVSFVQYVALAPQFETFVKDVPIESVNNMFKKLIALKSQHIYGNANAMTIITMRLNNENYVWRVPLGNIPDDLAFIISNLESLCQ